MKSKHFLGFLPLALCVSFAYNSASGQVVEKVKDDAEKTKDVTVETAKKVGVVVTNGVDKAAAVTTDGTNKTVKLAQKFGNNAVVVTEDVMGHPAEEGRFLTTMTWNGARWVTKRVWFPKKKDAADAAQSEKP